MSGTDFRRPHPAGVRAVGGTRGGGGPRFVSVAGRSRSGVGVWHHAGMESLRVLEWVRHKEGIWNMPRSEVERLAADFPGVRFEAPGSREESDALLPEVDVVLGFAARPEVFATAKRLRWIHSTAAGVEGILSPELVASDVVLTCSRGLHAQSIAEHVIGTMLAFARQLHVSRDAQLRRAWSQHAQWGASPGFEQLHGATIGLVGFGQIGRAIGEKARALGMRVIAVRRHPADPPDPAHAQWGPDWLPELLERSDWIVLAAPHTRESAGLIGADQLKRMKPTARLVNIGRGALVDEAALVAALRDGRLAGAALDVMEREPLPDDSPLWDMPNVILTPHVSGLGPRYWERATDVFAANLRRWLDGEPLQGVVDKQAGY
jgi:phosphoglycerate dehydrogenase-like enzyme